MTNFITKQISSQLNYVYEVSWSVDNRDARYCYIWLDKAKREAFLRALKSPPVDLESYGKILCTGLGVPNKSLKDRIISALEDSS